MAHHGNPRSSSFADHNTMPTSPKGFLGKSSQAGFEFTEYANLVTWISPRKGEHTVNGSNNFTAISDLSANNATFTINGTPNLSTINGLPAIQFVNSEAIYCTIGDDFDTGGQANCTMFAVVEITNSSSQNYIMSVNHETNSRPVLDLINNITSPNCQYRALRNTAAIDPISITTDETYSVGDKHIVTYRYIGSSMTLSIWVNGVKLKETSDGFNSSNLDNLRVMTIGGQYYGGTVWGWGSSKIGDAALFSDAKSDAQILEIATLLMQLYGIS